jgi:hypothetical protein
MTRGHGDVQAIGHRKRHITHTVFFPDFLLEKLTKKTEKKLKKPEEKEKKTDEQEQQREQHRMRLKQQQMAATASKGKSVKEEAP